MKSTFSFREYFNSDKLKLLSETLCLSHIQYMSLVWGAATVKTIERVNIHIKSMARFVLEKQKFDPITHEMTKKLGWLLPKHLYTFFSLSKYYLTYVHLHRIFIIYST